MKIKLPLRALAMFGAMSGPMSALVAPVFAAQTDSMISRAAASNEASNDKGKGTLKTPPPIPENTPIPEFVVPKDAPTISKGVLAFSTEIFFDEKQFDQIEVMNIENLLARKDLTPDQKRETFQKLQNTALTLFKLAEKLLKENQEIEKTLSSAENKNLKTQIETEKKDIENANAENEKLKTQLREVKTQIETAQKEIKNPIDATKLTEENEQLKTQVREVKTQIETAQKEIENASDAPKLTQEQEDLNDTIKKNVIKIEGLNNKNPLLKEEYTELYERIQKIMSNFHREGSYDSFLMEPGDPIAKEERPKRIKQLEDVIRKLKDSLKALQDIKSPDGKALQDNKITNP